MLAHSYERANSDSEGNASKVETQKPKHSVQVTSAKTKRDLLCRHKRLVN